MTDRGRFRPFAARGRLAVGAILVTFVLFATLTVASSIKGTEHSRNRATVVEVASRQRLLAQTYLNDILLRQRGLQADPAVTASILTQSVAVLLNGGTAPAVNGNDDDTRVPASTGSTLRAQILEEQRLVGDLTRTGAAVLAGRSPVVPLRGHEHLGTASSIGRLRVLGALTSGVALNTARSIARADDQNISSLLRMQVGLGAAGLLLALILSWALVRSTRRQTDHYRSLVSSSSELVLILGASGCRYASKSVVSLLGVPEEELLGPGIEQFVHEDDRAMLAAAAAEGTPDRLLFRVATGSGSWAHLDAHLTDLRHDKHLQGVVINARDISKRIALEAELTDQARRDTFSTQLVEALEMADDELSAYDVVERAMTETEPAAPMELLLSDSSRAHLERVASSPTAGAPSCPVESPFSCVAVRRGNPVVFESSEALNACPKLRDRPGGSCSAVCVPISFMGRALGVLHSTGPVDQPLGREQVAQLTTLATQAGTRIGTVRAFEKTQLQAATDGLTGLDNRRTVERHLRDLVSQGRLFSIAFADLDHFKTLNDKHGHEAGDRALRLFGQIAHAGLRENDLMGRWGGEEFVFVFPDIDQVVALEVLERIRTGLEVAHTGDHPRFTASFGLTDSNHGKTVQQLVHLADSALYEAKHAGRDRINTSSGVALDAADDPADRTAERPGRRDTFRPGQLRRAASLHHAAADDDPIPTELFR